MSPCSSPSSSAPGEAEQVPSRPGLVPQRTGHRHRRTPRDRNVTDQSGHHSHPTKSTPSHGSAVAAIAICTAHSFTVDETASSHRGQARPPKTSRFRT